MLKEWTRIFGKGNEYYGKLKFERQFWRIGLRLKSARTSSLVVLLFWMSDLFDYEGTRM